jgi:hypothetical protein
MTSSAAPSVAQAPARGALRKEVLVDERLPGARHAALIGVRQPSLLEGGGGLRLVEAALHAAVKRDGPKVVVHEGWKPFGIEKALKKIVKQADVSDLD